MTKKDLSQLYWLNREIEDQQQKLEELEYRATSCSSYITGLPRTPGISDRVAECAAEIADIRGLIDLNLKKCFYELNRLNRYISSIEDSQIRTIFTFRYINGLTWLQIAMSIGGGNTADSIRKTHDRFLEKLSVLSG